MRSFLVVVLFLALVLASRDARAALMRDLDCPSAKEVPARAAAACESLQRHQHWVRSFGGHGLFYIGFATTPATVDAVVAELALTADDIPALRCLYDVAGSRRATRLMDGARSLLARVGPGAFDPHAACMGPLEL